MHPPGTRAAPKAPLSSASTGLPHLLPPRRRKVGRHSRKIMSLSKTERWLSGGRNVDLGQWERQKSARCAHMPQRKWMAWAGLGPPVLLRGRLACLLATVEVRVWKGNADPTSAPQGSPRPRRGHDRACFTASDPSPARGSGGDVI